MLFVIFDSKWCVCSCESTCVTPCNILFLSSANLQWWSSLGTRPDGRQPCFCVSHLMLFFSLSKLKKKQKRWGDIWLTPGCEVEHQAPPERPQSAKGRNVMMCQPASRHAWLPARRRSPTRSVYIIDRMKNSNLSRMRPAHLDTMGLHMRAVFNSD